MKKVLTPVLASLLCLVTPAGCAGTPAVYRPERDCPTSGDTNNGIGLKTGLVITTNIKDSLNATVEKYGEKMPAQVADIAVSESTVPTGADLTSSVTIAVGGFQALIGKAAQ